MLTSRPVLLIKKQLIKKQLIKKHFRPLGTWAGFAGLCALTGGVCPCCGQPACPNGLLGAGLVGTIFALVIQSRARIPR